MKITDRRTLIQLMIAAVLIAVFIAVNMAFIFNYKLITASFSTDNTEFDNEEAEDARVLGDGVVQSIANESMVLIENRNSALPLGKSERRVNLFGYGSSDAGFMLTGGGSGRSEVENESNKDKKISLMSAFEKEGFEYNPELAKIYTDYSTVNMDAYGSVMNLNEPDPSVYTQEVISRAKDFSDVAVVVISRNGRESYDLPLQQTKYKDDKTEETITDSSRTYLQLSTEEEGMIEIVLDNFSKVIVLLNTGNPMECGFLSDERISAALYVGYPGQSGALSIPRILKGDVNPSGALTTTYVYDREQYDPTAANMFRGLGYDTQIAYAEGIYTGYRWYETADEEWFFDDVDNEYGTGYDGVVQYPFGYGLSYTSFEWRVDGFTPEKFTRLTSTTEFQIDVTVTNSGNCAGQDIVQIYGLPEYISGEIEKSYINLLTFAKTRVLKPGESQSLKLTFTAYDLASYDDYDKNGNGFSGYELDGGEYTIKLMHDVRTPADCPNSELVYKVPEAVKFRRDPVTNVPVRNKFTGASAYAGVPIDGSNAGSQPIVYLSREDFNATYPYATAPRRDNTAVVEGANSYSYTGYDSMKKPVTSSGGDLRLTVRTDGTAATKDDLLGNTDVQLVYNDELALALGRDYEEPRWEQLLDQLSVSELCTLVEAGGFQTAAAESVGKPRRRDADGPAGFNLTSSYDASAKWTAYPNQALLACSWNKSLAYDLGRAHGVEANATQISGWYAPYANLMRNAYGGRCFESCGEDPVLTGDMCAEIVRGAKDLGLYSYVKHFALCETGVNPDNVKTWLTEQTLREIYLKPFEIAVKEGGANAMMTAVNCIGAVWSGANYALNEGILRKEWGFKGSVVTDYSYQRSFMDAARAIRGGNDFMLDVSASYSRLDPSDEVNLYLARKSAKNIIFTWLDTYVAATEYATNGSNDDGFIADITLKPTPLTFSPAPIIMLGFTDILLGGGAAACIYFVVKKLRRKDGE